jgi:dGTPase
MALGHDIGHTPFGHAGEEALNEELLSRKCTDDPLPIPLYGFDHCVHGVEVVTRIEDDYKKGENGYGLNLTFDVREGILKHMYDPDTKPDTVSKNEDTKKNKRPFSNLEKVVNYPAYKQFKSNKIIKSKKGSIEAQCVYLADKLSYLLSDVEAGIRSKILDIYKLRETSLFGFIKRLYKEQTGQDIMNERYVGVDDYLRFRRAALRIFILDTIKETERRSEKSEIKSFDDVVSCGKRLVYVSDKLNKKWDEFYQNKMRKKLFKAHDVCACTFKAKKIVTDLFKAYYDDLELIPQNYRKSTEKAYEGYAECGEIIKLIKVRNYVAGMTDAFATDQHSRLFMSSEKINL